MGPGGEAQIHVPGRLGPRTGDHRRGRRRRAGIRRLLGRYWDDIVIEDPGWRPDPDWKVVDAGLDHGKTNPTVLLRVYIDFNGVIYIAAEYYHAGAGNLAARTANEANVRIFVAWKPSSLTRRFSPLTLQQSQKSRPTRRAGEILQPDCTASRESKISIPSPGDYFDVSFVARLKLTGPIWTGASPRSEIVCPRGIYAEKPVPGSYDWGCPNLLWELMRTRREKLSAQQLLRRNMSEAIVDKDNHARDAMKYIVMSQPEPSRKSPERRAGERMQEAREQAKREGATDDQAMTNAMLRYTKLMHEEPEQENPSTYCGRNGRRIVDELQRRDK